MNVLSDALRQIVIERARGQCEYCGIHQHDSLFTHEIDHIIPLKHRGTSSDDNLCLACLDCNRHKGSDFASFDPESGVITSLFHPRRDRWSDHFTLHNEVIVPLSAVGRVTVYILRLNDEKRLRGRRALIAVTRYHPPA